MARKRYQQGSVALKGNNWTGRYTEDIRLSDGSIKRVQRRVILGTKTELPTRKLALRKLEPHLAKINSIEYRPRSAMTLADLVTRWKPLARPQYKPGTWRNFETDLRVYLLPRFGEKQLEELQTEVLQHFISTLMVGPSYVRNILKTLKAIWKAGRAWGYVRHDPFSGLMLPKMRRVESKCFSLAEVTSIIQTAAEPYSTLYWLAWQSGLRIGELLALSWDDVDLDRCILSVRASVWRGKLQSTKSAAADRTFPLSAKLVERLVRYRRERWRENGLNLLFTNARGNPCRADRLLLKELQPLLDRLGIERAGFHAFRHANATILDRMNAPMKIRQQRLGHSKAEMTLSIYTHVVNEDAREVAERFDEYLALSCPTPSQAIESTKVKN